MSEFQEYPKAIYHPETRAMMIVEDEEHEETVLGQWISAIDGQEQQEPNSLTDSSVVQIATRARGRPKKA